MTQFFHCGCDFDADGNPGWVCDRHRGLVEALERIEAIPDRYIYNRNTTRSAALTPIDRAVEIARQALAHYKERCPTCDGIDRNPVYVNDAGSRFPSEGPGRNLCRDPFHYKEQG